jgi:folate-binding protein YgfZ
LILAGPQSTPILQRLAAVKLPEGEQYISCAIAVWRGHPLMIRRLQERGFQSYHLAGEAAQMGPLWQALRHLGATPCGMRSLETVRIEEGFPVIGLDIKEKNLPQELGRDDKAISLNKGCYLGQEIVARIDSRGAVSKVLAGIRFQTANVPASEDALTRDGQAAGQVTSAAYSPRFGVSVGLAYLRRPFHEPGTLLESTVGPACVVELPMRLSNTESG